MNPERPVKYVRKQINYAELDDIGHGIKIGSATMRQPKSASINSRNSSTISRSQSQIDERLVFIGVFAISVNRNRRQREWSSLALSREITMVFTGSALVLFLYNVLNIFCSKGNTMENR